MSKRTNFPEIRFLRETDPHSIVRHGATVVHGALEPEFDKTPNA
jgi:hypothetical protein